MALTTFDDSKELPLNYQTVLLAKIELSSGSPLFLASRGLNVAEGGEPYLDGESYIGRIMNAQIAATQAYSGGGIDSPPSVELVIADPDREIWNTYEGKTPDGGGGFLIGPGFEGAKMTLRVAFYDPEPPAGATHYSTLGGGVADDRVIFYGTCGKPTADALTIRIPATSNLNVRQSVLPQIRIQRRCPWMFPESAAAKAEAEQFDSWYYPCMRRSTKFVTAGGVKSFEDFQDGDETVVLTHRGRFRRARVRCFGTQPINRITIGRRNHRCEVYATPNHRWILVDGSETTSLEVGNRLAGAPDIFSNFIYEDAPWDERLYWCYGFVYGDGTTFVAKGERFSGVRLHGHKKRFAGRFSEMGFPDSGKLGIGASMYVYMGRYAKTLPSYDEDPRLLRAFVRGYLDADGRRVNSRRKRESVGSPFSGIQVTGEGGIDFIRSAFPEVGMYITREDHFIVGETNKGKRTGPTIEFSLTSKVSPSEHGHAFLVKSIEPAGSEEVWCLQVEEDGSFVLPNGLVTGNCGASDLNGNPVPVQFSTYCDRTKQSCVDRGKWNLATGVGRFGGFQWQQPTGRWEGISKIEGKVKGRNNDQEARYDQFVPMVYGRGWLSPPVISLLGDANYTRMELLLGYGQVRPADSEQRVWVNSEAVTSQRNDEAAYWVLVSNGDRDGQATNITVSYHPDGGAPQGDCFGSMAHLFLEVIRQVAESGSTPSVRLLVDGPKLRKYYGVLSGAANAVTLLGPNLYLGAGCKVIFLGTGTAADGVQYTVTDPVTYAPIGSQYGNGNGTITLTVPLPAPINGGYVEFEANNAIVTATGAPITSYLGENPAWVLMDMLSWANWQYNDMNIATFIKAARFYATAIPFKNNAGVDGSRPRFICAMVLREPRSISELLSGLLSACRSYLTMGRYGLELRTFQTLAEEQSEVIAGSNDITEYANAADLGGFNAKKCDGTAGTGFIAYHFNESNIERDQSGHSTVQLVGSGESPNYVSLAFEDDENEFVVDSDTIVDSEDITRTGREIPSTIPLIGITNRDQFRRIGASMLMRGLRGNPRGTAGGSWEMSFTTTSRATHLRVGHIVAVSLSEFSLTKQLFRIQAIQPSFDYRRILLRLQWHEDNCYLDTTGQGDAPLATVPSGIRPGRPYPWKPYYLQISAADPFAPGQYTFAADYYYKLNEDGTSELRIKVMGYAPINAFAGQLRPPYVAGKANSVNDADGHLEQGVIYFIGLVAKDMLAAEDYKCARPRVITASVLPGHNAIAVQNIHWGSTVPNGYLLFLGTSTETLAFQEIYDGAPPTDIVVKGPQLKNTFGLPDSKYHRMRLDYTKVVHAGVCNLRSTGVPAGAVFSPFLDGGNMGVNAFQNRHMTVIGDYTAQKQAGFHFPVLNYRIMSNDATTLTADRAMPEVDINDYVAVRIGGPTCVITATTFQDPLFLNKHNPPWPISNVRAAIAPEPAGTVIEIRAHQFKSGDRVWISGITGATEANGDRLITVLDEHNIWVDVVSSPYLVGGVVQLYGLRPGAEKGNKIRIIAGTGARCPDVKITDNTVDTLTVDQWAVTPDTTSRMVILADAWQSVDAGEFGVTHRPTQSEVQWEITANDMSGEVMGIETVTVDADEQDALAAPFRDFYIYPVSFGAHRRFVKANTTVMPEDDFLIVDCTAGDITIMLPPSAERRGNVTITYEAGTNKIIIDANATETIDGALTLILDSLYSTVELQPNSI